MRGLSRLAWRSLWARPLRTSLTVIGVALGVAILFAGLATDSAIDAAADRAARDMLGRAAIRVAGFSERGLSDATLDAVRATSGVASTAPALERRTYLGPSGGRSGLGPAVTVVGVDPAAEAIVHPWPLAAGVALEGVGPASADAAVITERLAGDDGLAVGSSLSIQGAGTPVVVRVVGILAGDGPPTGAGDAGRVVVIPLETARAAFGDVGLSRIDVALATGPEGAVTATVLPALERSLLVEPYAVTTAPELAASLRASTAGTSATMALIAAVVLFVGAFLIVNTLSMTVSERTREVGLLRAAGATRGQARRYILAAAFVIGVLGALVGLILGWLLAIGLAAGLGSLSGLDPGLPGVPLVAAVAAALAGLLVTLAAAIEPARQAAAIPPVAALRPGPTRAARQPSTGTWLVAVFVVVALVAVVLWPALTGASGGTALTGDGPAVRALAVYVLLVVMTLLLPILVPVLARVGGLPFRLPFRVEERLARATLVRDRGRASLTLGALTVGLALVVALGSVSAAAQAASGSWVAEVVPGDVLVTSIRPVAPDEGVEADLGAVPGVASISPIGSFELAAKGRAVDGAAVEGSRLAGDGRLRFVAGDRDGALRALDAGGSVILPRALAERWDLGVGGTLEVTDAAGADRPLTVVGIVERSLPGRSGEAALVGWSEAVGHLGVSGADAFAVRLQPSTAATDGLAAAATRDGLELVPLDRVSGAIDDALRRVFDLFDALAVLAVIVAALGIVNTLMMDVVERVREIGILRAAGMTRRQVWRSVVVEAGVVGVAGSALGSVVGIAIGLLLAALAGVPADGAITVPWPTVALAFLLGVALAMLAAAYPARLAARISIPTAVAFE